MEQITLLFTTITKISYLDYSIRLVASLLCALFLGIERKQHQEIVGITCANRTTIKRFRRYNLKTKKF